MLDLSKFKGKTVAIRGIGSGVNVGICVDISGTNILLEPGSFFCRQWDYKKSHGAFHSLANGDVIGGTITKTDNDTVITDVAQIVVCAEGVMDVLEKAATSK